MIIRRGCYVAFQEGIEFIANQWVHSLAKRSRISRQKECAGLDTLQALGGEKTVLQDYMRDVRASLSDVGRVADLYRDTQFLMCAAGLL